MLDVAWLLYARRAPQESHQPSWLQKHAQAKLPAAEQPALAFLTSWRRQAASLRFLPYIFSIQLCLKWNYEAYFWRRPAITYPYCNNGKATSRKRLRLSLSAYCRLVSEIIFALPVLYTLLKQFAQEPKGSGERHRQQNYMRSVPFRTRVQCRLLMQDEVRIAALVLAARGHTLPSAKSLPTDTARLNLLLWRGQRVWNGIPLPACTQLNCPCIADIAQRPAVSGCRGFT